MHLLAITIVHIYKLINLLDGKPTLSSPEPSVAVDSSAFTTESLVFLAAISSRYIVFVCYSLPVHTGEHLSSSAAFMASRLTNHNDHVAAHLDAQALAVCFYSVCCR